MEYLEGDKVLFSSLFTDTPMCDMEYLEGDKVLFQLIILQITLGVTWSI